jgi:beta-mannosidase
MMGSTSGSSLSGAWQFRAAPAGGGKRPRVGGDRSLSRWMDAAVPGTVHGQLHRLGKIPDPYYGQNELQLQWIDELDWEWSRRFTASESDCTRRRQELIFDGIDTVATILLNGKEIGRSVNMFRQVVCDVRGVLRAGENEILVRLKSPTAYAAEQAKRGKQRVEFGSFTWVPGESRPTGRAWIRKVQCQFGWDWGVYLATSGIWQDVRLECADAPRIASVKVVQQHVGPIGRPGKVRLQVTAELAGYQTADGVLRVSCGGVTTSMPAPSRAGVTTVSASITIEEPRLWWPHGHGEQPLYDLELQWTRSGAGEDGEAAAAISTARRRIGLRTLELVRQADRSPDGKPAESFFFKINGRAIFAKGANWIPADQFIERCTPAVYQHLLGSMVDANMNMVRVWGGGWYEQDFFYDLCDQLGILVWQDFMMACALYPDTPDLMAELNAEARYQVRRLHSRPCIAVWCGDNEDMGAVFEWWRASPDFAKNVSVYKKVMKSLAKTVEAEDSTRAFWISSPCNGEIGEFPDNPNFGDVHYWKVWHKKEPFSNYLTVKPRFASEFGFQSFPEPKTIRAVVPAAELNPSSRVMEHHQRSPDGNMLITNTIARELPIPKDFDSYCWASQINQAMAIRTAVEHWRRLRPWCMGTIYWQLNDLWPVASWSSIDYHGRWKALHHFAKRFYAPLLVSMLQEGNELAVWATSDLAEAVELQGELEVLRFDGKRIARRPLVGKLAAGGSKAIARFAIDELLAGKVEARNACAFVRVRGGKQQCENFANLAPWKWATLSKPALELQVEAVGGDGIALHVQSKQVTPFFHANLQGLEGHFEGDWNVLRPGRRYVMPWVPHTPLGATVPTLAEARERLTTMSLYDTLFHEPAAAEPVDPADPADLAAAVSGQAVAQ